MPPTAHPLRRFTLIELLVVVAIIAILVALLLPQDLLIDRAAAAYRRETVKLLGWVRALTVGALA